MKLNEHIVIGIIVLCNLFLGCKSVQAMKTDITNQMPKREQSIPSYQYYVSRNIVLNLVLDPKSTVDKRGVARLHKTFIQISKSTPGIAPIYDQRDGRQRIGVSFEKDENGNDLLLWFIQDDTDPQSSFHFDWVGVETEHIVNYGGVPCYVAWDFKGAKLNTNWTAFWLNFFASIKGFFRRTNLPGANKEPPYLIIKLKKYEDLRGAKGRMVQ